MRAPSFVIVLICMVSTTIAALLAYRRAREAVDVLVECNHVLTRCVATLDRARLACRQGESP